MSNGEPDIIGGTVDLIERYEALEQVPCQATAEVIANLEGQLGQIQAAGCCDCQVSIAGLRMALESTQAVPLGQIAGAIAKLDLTLSSLPQMPMAPNGPIGQLPPGTTIILPAAPPPASQQPSPGESDGLIVSPAEPAPVDGLAPTGPAVPPHVPVPGEVCPPDPEAAPEPGELVKVAPDCGAELHALGGPVAERTMQMPLFLDSDAGGEFIGRLRGWYGPVWNEIDLAPNLNQLVIRSLRLLVRE